MSRTHTTNSNHSININRMIEECQILLSLQEMDLELQGAMQAEEQVCELHSFDWWDLSTELEELHVSVAEVEGEHAAEAGELSALVIEASNALVDLGMLHIWEVP
jgi:hypothetical protein